MLFIIFLVVGQCLCDLTGNECDVNCCCDQDCTTSDIEAFICDKRFITYVYIHYLHFIPIKDELFLC